MLGLAENSMMHPEITEYTQRHVRAPDRPPPVPSPTDGHQLGAEGSISPVYHLTYGNGPRGSRRLLDALAGFLTAHFGAREAVRPGEMAVLCGVSSVVDAVVWAVCDDGDGVIIPRPVYSGFQIDVCNRARGVILPAAFQHLEGYKGLDDVFDPQMNVRALEAAYEKGKKDGVPPKAVILVRLVLLRTCCLTLRWLTGA